MATPGVGAGGNADSGQTHFAKTRLSAGSSGRRRADRPATGRSALGEVGRMKAKAFELPIQDDHLAHRAQTRDALQAVRFRCRFAVVRGREKFPFWTSTKPKHPRF